MAEKYIIFIDIDGTLTVDNYEIPPENIKWLKKAQAAGCKVFINTGRSYGNIPEKLLKGISFADGIVCGNGSHIILNGEHIIKNSIPLDVVCELIDYVKNGENLWCMLEGEKEVLFVNQDEEGYGTIADSDEFRKYHADSPMEVIAVGDVPPESFEKDFEGKLNVFRLQNFADCVKAGCSKANGIKKVLELTGFDREHTMAIGDSENDRSMLELAGIAVVMANAPDSIKEAADFITLSNREAGVAKAVEKLIFKE